MPRTTNCIRWFIRRDMPEVLAIEADSYEWAWSEEDFLRYLRDRNTIGMVVEQHEKVIGFMIYELHKSHLNLVNVAVHPDYRRQGVGTAMATKLKDKLSRHRRTRVVLIVRESNVDNSEDAYQMEYRIDGDYAGIKPKRRVLEADLTNRISQVFRRK